jgi:hypothetical protein
MQGRAKSRPAPVAPKGGRKSAATLPKLASPRNVAEGKMHHFGQAFGAKRYTLSGKSQKWL